MQALEKKTVALGMRILRNPFDFPIFDLHICRYKACWCIYLDDRFGFIGGNHSCLNRDLGQTEYGMTAHG